jgi:hypothetical protein
MNNEMNPIVGRELTDQELMTIQGGSFFSAIGSVFSTVGNALAGGVKAVGTVFSVLGPPVGHAFSTIGRALVIGRRVIFPNV